jgi:hypothetical protein
MRNKKLQKSGFVCALVGVKNWISHKISFWHVLVSWVPSNFAQGAVAPYMGLCGL